MNNKIVLLGSGSEIHQLLIHLSKNYKISAFGCTIDTRKNSLQSILFCEGKGIDIIEHHSEAIKYSPDFVFMINYPNLIEAAHLSKTKFINMHYALLPRYRGFHGVTWAIINGEKKIGYTIHEVDEGIDSGPIYNQCEIFVDINDDVNIIRKNLYELFIGKGLHVYDDIINNKLITKPQIEEDAIYVCRRYQDDGAIHWDSTAFAIHNLIRALKPPYTLGAFTFYNNQKLFILNSELCSYPEYSSVNGQVVNIIKGKGVLVKCQDTVLLLKDVILNDKQINSADLFRKVGFRFKNHL